LYLPIQHVNIAELNDADKELKSQLHHAITFITLSEKGVFYNDGKEAVIIPSHIRNISDVSGAGDTVIASAAVVYALTKNVRLMAEVSNIAGGLVCEEVGVVPIDKQLLIDECVKLLM
jgi:bifunctional ADP-heptose synthase (sugar kinase/adenylyltransferase)